jgi:hypothetical protein
VMTPPPAIKIWGYESTVSLGHVDADHDGQPDGRSRDGMRKLWPLRLIRHGVRGKANLVPSLGLGRRPQFARAVA